jgi:hypothetical protein
MPDQKSLEGMTDRKLEALQDAAYEYVKVRDKRMELTKTEVEKKGEILKLMHKHKKDVYNYEDVHIEIVIEEENVKVRVKKAKADKAE